MTTDVLAYSAGDSNGNSLSTTGFNLAHERSVTFQALFKTRAGPLPFPFLLFLISLPLLLLLLLEKNVRLVSSGVGRHAGSDEEERMRETGIGITSSYQKGPSPPRDNCHNRRLIKNALNPLKPNQT